MTNLSYLEKMTIQLMRNKKAGVSPQSRDDIAKKFNLSKVYVSTVMKEIQNGPAAKAWRKKFAEYAGLK